MAGAAVRSVRLTASAASTAADRAASVLHLAAESHSLGHQTPCAEAAPNRVGSGAAWRRRVRWKAAEGIPYNSTVSRTGAACPRGVNRCPFRSL